MAKCTALTKSGKPCPFDARPSGLCHIHDPAVQCGAPTKSGRQCEVATGGGRCKLHADHVAEVAAAMNAARQAVAAALAAEVDRDSLTEAVGTALLDIRALVWPHAAPAKLPISGRDPRSEGTMT